MWKERLQGLQLGTSFPITCSQRAANVRLPSYTYCCSESGIGHVHILWQHQRCVCVSDLFLGIPSRNTPLGNSRWTRSITTDLFSQKTLSEANFLWLKCTRGAHGQNTGKRSKVTNVFEVFYIGCVCLTLVTYKTHIGMETHVKNVCSYSCPLPKLFLCYLCRHWGRVHCSSTAAGGSWVQLWALAAEFGAQ